MKEDNVLNHILLKIGVPDIVNSTKAVPGGTVVVAWDPPFEGACPVIMYTVYYRKVAKNSKWQSVTVKGKTNSYTLQLKCREEYEVAVTSMSGYKESAFNESKIWNFKTQGGDVAYDKSCTDTYRTWPGHFWFKFSGRCAQLVNYMKV